VYWREVLRVLKPGGHALVFAAPRTVDLMGLALRIAGFEVRDCLAWINGQGFPKNHDVSKAIDKAAGATREVVGAGEYAARRVKHNGGLTTGAFSHEGHVITTPATPDAAKWAGFGTSLKPAVEPVILARKPLIGTVAANVLEHGTGAINVDGCRLHADDKSKFPAGVTSTTETTYGGGAGLYADRPRPDDPCPARRYPANVLLDEQAARELDEQTGHLHSAGPAQSAGRDTNGASSMFGIGLATGSQVRHGDAGGASRFFYCAKAPRKQRFIYCHTCGIVTPAASRKQHKGHDLHQHPTVKPLDVMRWLVRLITPPGGVVLDPFAGSGTTLVAARAEGFDTIGCELDPDSARVIIYRLQDTTT
jgi:site-specific DNA-methyltransferase (adenine-specific)